MQGAVNPNNADKPLVGILLLVAALAIVPCMDAIAKHLSDRFPTAQLVWARYFFHFFLLLPLVVRQHGWHAFLPRRPLLQVVRGSLLLVSTALFFAALAVMPLADAIATIFVYPFIITALSPWLLGETVGARRWAAVAVGFAGACIIIRPGAGALQAGALLAVGAAASYACFVLVTRKLANNAPPLVTLAFTGFVGAAATSLVMPFVWVAPTPQEWLLMAAMGLFAAAGHFLLILAYERAAASLLAPFGYSEIIGATILGYLVFGDFPDVFTWAGIAIVCASGIYISVREAQIGRKASAAGPARGPGPAGPTHDSAP